MDYVFAREIVLKSIESPYIFILLYNSGRPM